jgi:hypothetical protein
MAEIKMILQRSDTVTVVGLWATCLLCANQVGRFLDRSEGA